MLRKKTPIPGAVSRQNTIGLTFKTLGVIVAAGNDVSGFVGEASSVSLGVGKSVSVGKELIVFVGTGVRVSVIFCVAIRVGIATDVVP